MREYVTEWECGNECQCECVSVSLSMSVCVNASLSDRESECVTECM